jgi:hypothetical protein
MLCIIAPQPHPNVIVIKLTQFLSCACKICARHVRRHARCAGDGVPLSHNPPLRRCRFDSTKFAFCFGSTEFAEAVRDAGHDVGVAEPEKSEGD